MIKELIRGDFKYVVRCRVGAKGVFCRVSAYSVDTQDDFGKFTFFQKSYDESDILKRVDEHYASLLSKPIEVVRIYSRFVRMLDVRDGVLNKFMRDENISPELSRKVFSLIFDVREIDKKLFSFVASLSGDDIEKMKGFRYFHSEVNENSFWSEFSFYEIDEEKGTDLFFPRAQS